MSTFCHYVPHIHSCAHILAYVVALSFLCLIFALATRSKHLVATLGFLKFSLLLHLKHVASQAIRNYYPHLDFPKNVPPLVVIKVRAIFIRNFSIFYLLLYSLCSKRIKFSNENKNNL